MLSTDTTYRLNKLLPPAWIAQIISMIVLQPKSGILEVKVEDFTATFQMSLDEFGVCLSIFPTLENNHHAFRPPGRQKCQR